MVVAGDAAYNGVHQYLAESDSQGRQDWLAALDVIEALDPRAVVAGHKRYGNDDDPPRIISETRQYILDFDRLDRESRPTAEELYSKMLAIHPGRVNPGAELYRPSRQKTDSSASRKGRFRGWTNLPQSLARIAQGGGQLAGRRPRTPW